MTGRQYGTLGLAGVGAFAIAVVALHFVEPDLSFVSDYISTYALGDYGWLERAAEVALGVGLIAIALGLRETLAPGKRVTASWTLLLIAGLAGAVGGLFATDPGRGRRGDGQWSNHDLAGYVSLLSTLIAAWLLRGVFARDRRYEHLARAQSWFAVLLTVALVLLFALYPLGVVGLIQRIYGVVAVTWLFVLAAKLRQVEATGYASVAPERA